MDTKNINTTALAYMGDAVYETYIREHVMQQGYVHSNELHRAAVKYVSAGGQAKAIKAVFDDLTEEEQKLVKRARNHKTSSKAKNADPVTYKWATALEALIGKTHLDGDIEREKELIERIIKVIEE